MLQKKSVYGSRRLQPQLEAKRSRAARGTRGRHPLSSSSCSANSTPAGYFQLLPIQHLVSTEQGGVSWRPVKQGQGPVWPAKYGGRDSL